METIRRAVEYMDTSSFKLHRISSSTPIICQYGQVSINKEIFEIENIQRRSTELVPGLWELPYPERLEVLKIAYVTLVSRNMIEM